MRDAIQYAILGGCCIGFAAVLFYAGLGRIAGISGIFANFLRAPVQNAWALLFVLGLGIGGWVAKAAGLWDPASSGENLAPTGAKDLWLLLLGGLLVGFGTRMGSGCTSGHGVCGMARLSKRSLAATLTFVGFGMLTATVVQSL